jgi:poly-gamma-glutamate capsule biosynthesis protein CapA/YwtB (metallophosphatase superfamily)
MNRTLSLLFAGDCGPTHGDADGYPIAGYTELLGAVLDQADLRFVNCMRTYSAGGEKSADAPQVDQPIEMAAIYTSGRFDAVTMSNNHSYDAGPRAMLQTRQLFVSRGVQVTGAGRDLAEARRPAILERDGIRVGYLGYTSVAKPEAEATAKKPGVTSIRVKTCYETRGPHAPVRVRTEPDAGQLDMLLEDIRAMRREVDIAVLAFHAGVIRLPRVIADYQVTVAHAAIDAGADLVIGHSPHIPKAIEMYKGKAIFYSLGVFAMTKSFAAPSWHEPAWMHGAVRNHVDLDPGYPFMPYGKPCTMSLLANAYVTREGVQKLSFRPVMFDSNYRPVPLTADDPRFRQVVDYLEWASEDMPHAFTIVGDEVVVS